VKLIMTSAEIFAHGHPFIFRSTWQCFLELTGDEFHAPGKQIRNENVAARYRGRFGRVAGRKGPLSGAEALDSKS